METIGEKNTGSADIKESKFLRESDVLFFCCCCFWTNWKICQFEMLLGISVFFSKTNQIKTCLYSRMWKSIHSWSTLDADSLHGHKFWAACGRLQIGSLWPLQTWADENFYVMQTTADPCRYTDAQSMNWPLRSHSWNLSFKYFPAPLGTWF